MPEQKKALLERLLARRGSELRAFFYRRLQRRGDAAELAQEVYLRMLRVPESTMLEDPEAYLFTVAANLVREQGLKDRREQRGRDLDDPVVESQLAQWPSPGSEIDQELRMRRLAEVLAELPPKCQAAIKLQYWHGQSYVQIADQLGVSTHMVKKYHSQAIVHCRRRMARLG